MKKMAKHVSNDPLWAALAGLGAVACVATIVFGGLEEGTPLYTRLESWGEALGAFMLGAIARWRLSGGDDAA